MTTQTLRGLLNLAPYHWRGDKQNFAAFNPAFNDLMGGTPLSDSDMTAYTNFINTIVFQPNPFQRMDRSLPALLAGGNPVNGQNAFVNANLMNPPPGTCNSCHTSNPGPGTNLFIQDRGLQPLKVPHLRNVYQKLLYTLGQSESIDGFGLDHAGFFTNFAQFFTASSFVNYSATQKRDMGAYMLCFDTGTAPAVGLTQTLTAANVATQAVKNTWTLLQNQAKADNIDLIYDRGSGCVKKIIQPDLGLGMRWLAAWRNEARRHGKEPGPQVCERADEAKPVDRAGIPGYPVSSRVLEGALNRSGQPEHRQNCNRRRLSYIEHLYPSQAVHGGSYVRFERRSSIRSACCGKPPRRVPFGSRISSRSRPTHRCAMAAPNRDAVFYKSRRADFLNLDPGGIQRQQNRVLLDLGRKGADAVALQHLGDLLMETVLRGFLQALEESNQAANDPPELGFVGVHRRDARAQNEALFEPCRGYGRALPPFALMECRHVAHLPDAGNAVYGGSTQQIRAFRDFDAGSEVQHVK